MKTMTIEELSNHILRRKAALGLSGRKYVTPNSGGRRTESKAALLRAIRDAAATEEEPSVFSAKI